MCKHCKILVVVVVAIFNHITNTFVKHFYCNNNLLVFNNNNNNIKSNKL